MDAGLPGVFPDCYSVFIGLGEDPACALHDRAPAVLKLSEQDIPAQEFCLFPPIGLSLLLHVILLICAFFIPAPVSVTPVLMRIALVPMAVVSYVDAPGVQPDSALNRQVKEAQSVTEERKSACSKEIPFQPIEHKRIARKQVAPRKEVPKQVEPVAATQTSERVEPVPTAPDISTVAQDTDISAVGSSSDVSEAKHSEASAQHGTGIGGTGKGQGLPLQTKFGDADGPRFVQRVVPKYPELARRKGREGLVMLRLTIAPDGRLLDVRVEDGGGFGFEDAAMEAVRNSTYAPATRNGQAVECSALLPIRFALQGT